MVWSYETLYPDIKIGLKGKLLYKTKTAYQDLRIYDNPRFGKVLFLDGAVQTTTKDEFIYHEMLTHPLLLAHPNPKNVLVIGAGDGGILREVLKHRIKKAIIVELDEEVITSSKKYLPSISKGAFSNKKVKIVIDDGAKFVAQTKEKFDVVIVDSPDPVGPAKVLFSKKFYTDIFSVLTKNGLMIRQTGSTILQPKEIGENYKILTKIFPYVTPQIAAIPTYIGGFFSFLIASKSINYDKIPFKTIERRYNQKNLKTQYYNPYIHFASTKLPNYVRLGDKR
jgi:spermidine synthase